MTCPWCPFGGPARELHAHLAERHGDAAAVTERHGRLFYEVTCPLCGARYEHLIRKGSRDPGFRDEFSRQIQMVALDMLVHHLAAEHGDHPPPGDGRAGSMSGGRERGR